MCKNKEVEGLGLGFLEWRNKALLLKWAWKFGTDIESLWRRVVIAKRNLEESSLFFHKTNAPAGGWSKLMGDIFKVLSDDDMISLSFRNSLLVIIDDGKHTNLWNDSWATNEPLNISFPRIFAICENKEVTVANVGKFEGGKWQWNLSVRRRFFDWEGDIYEEFNRTINGVTPSANDHHSIAGF